MRATDVCGPVCAAGRDHRTGGRSTIRVQNVHTLGDVATRYAALLKMTMLGTRTSSRSATLGARAGPPAAAAATHPRGPRGSGPGPLDLAPLDEQASTSGPSHPGTSTARGQPRGAQRLGLPRRAVLGFSTTAILWPHALAARAEGSLVDMLAKVIPLQPEPVLFPRRARGLAARAVGHGHGRGGHGQRAPGSRRPVLLLQPAPP